MHLLDVVTLLIEVDEFSASLVDLFPHFWELSLVRVEWDHHLVGELVGQVGPEHLRVLALDVEHVVARPLALVHV